MVSVDSNPDRSLSVITLWKTALHCLSRADETPYEPLHYIPSSTSQQFSGRLTDEEKKVSWTKTVCNQKVEASSPASLASQVSIIPSLTTPASRAFYLILSSLCAFTSSTPSRLQLLLSPCMFLSRLQLVSFSHRDLSSRNTSAKSFLTFPSRCHKISSHPIILHFLDKTFHVCVYKLSIW